MLLARSCGDYLHPARRIDILKIKELEDRLPAQGLPTKKMLKMKGYLEILLKIKGTEKWLTIALDGSTKTRQLRAKNA